MDMGCGKNLDNRLYSTHWKEFYIRLLGYYLYLMYLCWQGSIFIPGDNDIGGEGADRVTLKKISRFEQAFGEGKPTYSPCSFIGENMQGVYIKSLGRGMVGLNKVLGEKL